MDLIQSVEDLYCTKRLTPPPTHTHTQGRGNSSCLPDWAGTLVFSCLWTWTDTLILGSQVSWLLDWNYISSPGSPACQLHIILGFLSLRNHVSQFHIINLFIIYRYRYRCRCICVCVCIYIYIYIYTYTHTHTHTHTLLVVSLLIWRTLIQLPVVWQATSSWELWVINYLSSASHFLIAILYLKFSINALYFKAGSEAAGTTIWLH